MPSPLTKSQQELFDEWYSIYPTKVGRGGAEKAWEKANPSRALTDILKAAVHAQTADRSRKANTGGFVPDWKHPATWLNQRCWEDEYLIQLDGQPQDKRPFGLPLNEITLWQQDGYEFASSPHWAHLTKPRQS